MSIFKHTLSLTNKLTNIYKMGGVKFLPLNSSYNELNLSTHTCGRLFARALQRVAFVVSIAFMLASCQQATLIPDEEVEVKENTRSEEGEAPADSTTVSPEFDVNGWDEAINADFTFGGEEQEGGNQ